MADHATIKSGFYNSINGDRIYSAEDFGRMFESLIPYNSHREEYSGVFSNPGSEFNVVVDNENQKIKVGKGKAISNGIWVNSETVVEFDVATNTTGSDRTDSLYIEINNDQATRKAIMFLKTGKTNQELLTYYDTVPDTYAIMLGYITVPANRNTDTIKYYRSIYSYSTNGIASLQLIRQLQSSGDFNKITETGLYFARNVNNYTNRPTVTSSSEPQFGMLEVLNTPNSNSRAIMQRLTVLYDKSASDPGIFIRYGSADDTTNTVAFNPWMKYGSKSKLTAGVDYFDAIPTNNTGRQVGELIFVKASN